MAGHGADDPRRRAHRPASSSAGWRILTDPTFDPPGRRYGFGWGTSSTQDRRARARRRRPRAGRRACCSATTTTPTTSTTAGRALLPAAGTVRHHRRRRPAARRCQRRGLRAGERPPLQRAGQADADRHGHAVPARAAAQPADRGRRHRLRAARRRRPDRWRVWMTGDTVLHRPVRQLAARLDVDVLLLHLGRGPVPDHRPAALLHGRRATRSSSSAAATACRRTRALRGLVALPRATGAPARHAGPPHPTCATCSPGWSPASRRGVAGPRTLTTASGESALQ